MLGECNGTAVKHRQLHYRFDLYTAVRTAGSPTSRSLIFATSTTQVEMGAAEADATL